MARTNRNYESLYNEIVRKYDDYAIRLEQINSLAKALCSMVGCDAKKEWITLTEMIYEKSDI